MNQPPIVGIERAHLEGLASGFHAIRESFDFLDEMILLDRAEMRTIHLDALGFGNVSAEDAVHQILEIVKPVPVLADECLALAGMDLKARTVVSFLDFDRGRESEVPEHRIEYFCC